MQNVKVDIIYYLTSTDFEMEFNLGGCCRMRTLTDRTKDIKSHILSLSRAVSRSKVIITCGPLFGDSGLIKITASAIGKEVATVNGADFGVADDIEISIIDGSTPLVTTDGIFGGCIIESGPQTLIVLTENREVRKNIMQNLIHPYIEELSIFDAKRSLQKTEDAEPEGINDAENIADAADVLSDAAAVVSEALAGGAVVGEVLAAEAAETVIAQTVEAAGEIAETVTDTIEGITESDAEQISDEVTEEKKEETTEEAVEEETEEAATEDSEEITEETCEETAEEVAKSTEEALPESEGEKAFPDMSHMHIEADAAILSPPVLQENVRSEGETFARFVFNDDDLPDASVSTEAAGTPLDMPTLEKVGGDLPLCIEPEMVPQKKINHYAIEYVPSTEDTEFLSSPMDENGEYYTEYKGHKKLNVSIIIIAALLLVIAVAICYILLYLPYQEGLTTSEFIEKIMSANVFGTHLLR